MFHKKIFSLRFALLTTLFALPPCIMPAAATESDATSQTDSASAEASEEKFVKTGWNFAPFPAMGYSSDLGMQLGALVSAYWFGDGSTYPEYIHTLTIQGAYYTKGSGIYHAFYDSKYLIPGFRITAAASYIPNTMMQFYGFNGYASPYHKAHNNGFYSIYKNTTRVLLDVQKSLGGNLNLAAGVAFYNHKVGSVKDKKYHNEPSLYKLYVENGIIRDDEKHGGSHLEFKAGVVYDSRDHEPDPTRGIYADAVLFGSPDIFNRRGYSYLKAAASFCQYIPVAGWRATFAYRLAYHGTLAGSAPFYIQSTYTTPVLKQIISGILGGSTSLRGVSYNRIASDGMVWANAEMRIRLFSFRLLGQEWYAVTNPFFDAGMSVRKYRLDDMKDATISPEDIYSGHSESLHTSAGLGLKLVMNNNFVVSAEYGIPLSKRDGKSGLYLILNYIF